MIICNRYSHLLYDYVKRLTKVISRIVIFYRNNNLSLPLLDIIDEIEHYKQNIF
jgi:hypothetical protein